MAQNGSAAESTLMATCPGCGDVVVSVGATRIGRTAGARPGWYEFDCPRCRRPVRLDAADHLVSVLACLGAVETVETPVGAAAAGSWRPEGTPRSSAPPLTVNDVLDATLALHTTDDLAALAAVR